MTIKFGPAGLGPVKDAVENLEEFHRLGLKACEIAFTYGVYIKKEEDMKMIKDASKRLGIRLSIHAPYWINLNSKDEEKVRKSKERILSCCEVGSKLGVEVVVFHSGFYGGMDEEESYCNIRDRVKEMLEVIKEKGWKIKLAPETMGKVNVFGSIEQIARLVKDTGCSFCLDFAHILAREKKVDYSRVIELFGGYDNWHVHFSGIEYGEKGERRHILTEHSEWEKLLGKLPKDKEIVIINESPSMVEDAVVGLKVNKKLM